MVTAGCQVVDVIGSGSRGGDFQMSRGVHTPLPADGACIEVDFHVGGNRVYLLFLRKKSAASGSSLLLLSRYEARLLSFFLFSLTTSSALF